MFNQGQNAILFLSVLNTTIMGSALTPVHQPPTQQWSTFHQYACLVLKIVSSAQVPTSAQHVPT